MRRRASASRSALALLLAALPALALAACRREPELPELFVMRRDGKWGYVNRRGEVVIQPQFPWASWFFSEGLAVACLEEDNKCGFIDPTGQFVIQPQFKDLSRFSEGLAAVKVGEKFGFIDRAGKLVVEPQFAEALPFNEGLAVVKVGEKYGFVGKDGKLAIQPQFDEAAPFFDGLAVASTGKKYGFIDKDGKFAIDPQFDEAEPFANGLAAVKVGQRFGYVDRQGKIVIAPQFDEAFPFSSEGLAVVVVDEKAGFVNKSGSYEIRPQYAPPIVNWAYAFIVATPDIGRVSFSEGLAPVRTDEGRKGYIDRTGRLAISLQAHATHPFYNGMGLVEQEGGSVAWVDRDGKYVWRETKAAPSPTPAANSNLSATPSPAPPAATNTAGAARTGYLTTDANLRSEPDSESTSVGIHFRRAKVRVLDEKRYERDGTVVTWYRVKVYEYGRSVDANLTGGKNSPSDADEGWVNAKLVMLD